MDIKQFIHPEFYILIPVTYVIGAIIKKSRVNDRLIPFIITAFSVTAAIIYGLSVKIPEGASGWFGSIFAALTQGTLCAAASVYTHNIFKQITEKEGEKGIEFLEEDREDDR